MAWPGRPPGTAAQVTTDCRSWHWRLVAGTNLEDSPLLTRAASPDGTGQPAQLADTKPTRATAGRTQPAPSPGRKAPTASSPSASPANSDKPRRGGPTHRAALSARRLSEPQPGADRKVIRAGRGEDLAAAPSDPAVGQDVVELHQRPVRRVGAPAHRGGVACRQPGHGHRHVEVPGDHGRNVVGDELPDEADQL